MRGPSIDELKNSYRSGDFAPIDLVETVLGAIVDRGDDGTWISVVDRPS